jgi:hypothetical protein
MNIEMKKAEEMFTGSVVKNPPHQLALCDSDIGRLARFELLGITVQQPRLGQTRGLNMSKSNAFSLSTQTLGNGARLDLLLYYIYFCNSNLLSNSLVRPAW